ncbi:Chitin catabolic cascade sensor histidine kinase ChiS [Photobacterium marinum]|uniref:histidine kinase n=1 Tax=Photobacterium marinum TaxID=1056511 RepID=L8J5J1_9GAMM|nr:response regulator [Photobacterium marinum]ELR63473.1 Chitin catabolic cascade sensor histidine kinase ChiS [Photobacterium marinum]
MQNTTRFKRLQHTLMLAFLVLSITPLTFSALFFLNSHTNDLAEQSTNHLASLLENKQKQLNTFFAARTSEVQSFARSELANASGGRFYGLVGAYNQLGDIRYLTRGQERDHYFTETLTTKHENGSDSSHYLGHERYRLIYKRYNWAYEEYLKRSDFSDILLVDIEGNVVYSTFSPNKFSYNLQDENTPLPALRRTFAAIKAQTSQQQIEPEHVPVAFTDFSLDQLSQSYTAWFAAPVIRQGYLHSYVFFQLRNDTISKLITDAGGSSTYVHTLLIGSDHQSRLSGSQSLPDNLTSPSIENALSGISGVGSLLNFQQIPVLSAFAPIDVFGNHWALVIELPEEEAFARIRQLEKLFGIAMVTAIVLVIIASHWLSNSITAPLLRLTWAAERVCAGDMDQKIEGTERGDELGRLATSFARMQRSVREKMALIRQQNNELEQSLQVIRQQNDELQTTDKLKDEFLATTSHELRTPLHGMVGIAESLLAGANGPIQRNQRRQLEMLINSGQRLTNLVDDLLDYHKMRYGDLDISKQPVDLASAVRLVLELSTHLLGGKPVRIINQIPDDLPLVLGDEQRLEQVLYNLVGNAIKYTSEGKIILSATRLENQLRIQVVDTGQGIAPEQLEHIFEPLIQANTNCSSYRQGAGLGLSISRQLIELMEGRLYVSSQPMVGTTFSFTLNLASEEDITEMQQPLTSSHFQAPSSENTHFDDADLPENADGDLLLIVDDEPVNLQVLTNYLRLEGYRVITAENGPQALELLESEQPALLLLDIMMPGMNGYEVCQQLRKEHTPLSLPIIMLSALGQVQDRVKGFEYGANDYLTKPFNKEELTARIRAHIQAGKAEFRHQKNQELEQEIKHREQIEAGLLETQSRLLGLLESSSEGIICVQEDGRIRYANTTAGKLFQRAPEVLERHKIEDILATHLPADITTSHHFNGSLLYHIGEALIPLETDVINLPDGAGLARMLIFDNAGAATQQRVQVLEDAVEVLSGFAFDGNRENLQQLRELGGEFTRLADKLNNTESKTDSLRNLLVDVMKATLTHWEATTAKSKFDLAEESGLWRVYLDRSTLQTRTLDKYLHLETLPKSPRWRTVLSTIDFVLERCQAPTPQRREIESMKDRLQHLLNH